MNIAVFGLGYVGCVTAACLVRDGHRVIGVDVRAEKVKSIQEGKCPIIEPGLPELIQDGVNSGRFEATYDANDAIERVELAMICVGTPSQHNGAQDLTFVEKVCRDIGQALSNRNGYMDVVVRSTVLPGAALERLLPLLEAASGKKAGKDFGFCVNPEFLREGSAVSDFDNPSYTIIGQLNNKSGEKIAQVYSQIEAPLYRVPIGVAEMVKYASNAFHALKVVFANEIGNVSQAFGIDSHRVMEVFVKDTKLNLSRSYLKPGFAFGGSCLGKDMRALLYAARQRDVRTPVLEGVLYSNRLQVEKVLEMLVNENRKKVALLGLSFKSNTDDLRESPAVELAERLIGKGFDLCIYDQEVSLSHLHGSNRVYIEQAIPHIGSLIRPTLEDTVRGSESVVVAKHLSRQENDILFNLLRDDQILIDLVRLNEQAVQKFKGIYRGICW